MEYEPHSYQQAFHESSARFRSIFAGRRSGKTVCGTIEALKESLEYHDCNGTDFRGVIVEPTYGDITRFLIPEIEKWWRPYIREFNKSQNKIVLNNGFVIHLLSSQEYDRFRGNKLRWLWLDEAEYYMYGTKLWEAAFPCLTDYGGKCWVTTTSRGKGWVYKTFYEPFMAGDPIYEAFVFKTIDNPSIPKEEIELARKIYPEKKFKIEYEASFEDFVGQIYYMFSRKDHIVNDFSIPRHWRVIKGMDVGYKHPFACVWIAIDPADRYFVFKEYRESGKTIKMNGEALVKTDLFSDSLFMVDPSIYHVDPVSGFAKSKDLEDLGIRLAAANNSVSFGIDRVSQLLHEGRLFICKSCHRTIEEISQYRWDDKKRHADGEPMPYKTDDDLSDALRYAIMEYYADRTEHIELPRNDPYRDLHENMSEDIMRQALSLDEETIDN